MAAAGVAALDSRRSQTGSIAVVRMEQGESWIVGRVVGELEVVDQEIHRYGSGIVVVTTAQTYSGKLD